MAEGTGIRCAQRKVSRRVLELLGDDPTLPAQAGAVIIK
jgi:hypothetical protein